MNSKERVKIAMSGGVPDRVPVIPQICHPHAIRALGMDALYVGETFGGLIGPCAFKEFCVPAFERFVRILKQYNILIYMHICGDSTKLFELVADTEENI